MMNIQFEKDNVVRNAAVVGSRTINDYEIVKKILGHYEFDRVVSGGANGIDSLAEKYSAEFNLLPPLIFLPNWKLHGRGAGLIRNKEIINSADFAIAIWDGKSKGTLSSIKHARKSNKKVDIWMVENQKFEKL
jgi:hypothetical protein